MGATRAFAARPDPRHHARAARRTGAREDSPARLGAPGHHRTASLGRVRPPRRGDLVTPAKRPDRRDRIRAQLADLKLRGALEALDPILSGVDGGRFTAAEAIEKLLAAQIGLRNNRRLQAAMRASRLPAVKTLADLTSASSPRSSASRSTPCTNSPSSTARRTLSSSGPRGVGKTHLAISLAVATAERGRRIYYGALADLITSLAEAQAAGRLQQRPTRAC